jgi:hypothetical protein
MKHGSSGAFGIGQVLSTSYGVVVGHFFVFFVLALVAGIPDLVIEILSPQKPPDWIGAVAPGVEAAPITPALRALSPWIVVPLVLAGIALKFILSAAATYLMIADLRSTAFRLGEALAAGLRALLPLLGIMLVLMLMFLGFAIVVGFIWAALTYGIVQDPKSPLGALVIPLFVVPVVIVALRLSLIVPVLVAERAGPVTSMRRSADLTKGSIWRILGLFVVVGLILLAINAVLVGGAIAVVGMKALFLSPIAIVAQHAIASAEVPFYWAVVAALYYHLRTQSESSAATPA